MNIGKQRWAAVFFGFFLAAAVELASAWYAAGRGYGRESQGYMLEPESTQDYEVTDGRWTVTGEVPMIMFRTDQDLGHIHFAFKEPLAGDTVVVLYYVRDPSGYFDRFNRTKCYMVKGTREAELSIPFGGYRSFRLEIRGDFVPGQMTVVPSVPMRKIDIGEVLAQVKLLRAAVLGFFFAAGLGLWFGRSGRGKTGSGPSSGKDRTVYLDLVRILAAALVIVVHVTEPMTLTLPQGSRLYLLTRGISIGALTCNLLFVLISGALLLPYREEPAGAFVKKRLAGVVLPLMVYAVFYVRGMCITTVQTGTWAGYYLQALAGGNIVQAPHLWLVYELAALYLLVVPFRYMLKNLPEKLEKALALTILILLAVHTASVWFRHPVGIKSFLGDWPGIFLLGYFLTRNWMRRYDAMLVAAGVAAFALSLWIQGFRADYKEVVCNQSILMAFMSMAVFVTVMHMDRWLRPFQGFLSACSGYSYSVLLVHWYVLDNFIYHGWMTSQLPAVVQLVVPILVCLFLSLVISVLTDRLVVDVLDYGIRRVQLRKM